MEKVGLEANLVRWEEGAMEERILIMWGRESHRGHQYRQLFPLYRILCCMAKLKGKEKSGRAMEYLLLMMCHCCWNGKKWGNVHKDRGNVPQEHEVARWKMSISMRLTKIHAMLISRMESVQEPEMNIQVSVENLDFGYNDEPMEWLGV